MEQGKDNVQKAYEHFMVSGKKNVSTPPTGERVPASSNHKQQIVLKKAEKEYWQIVNAFQGTLERDWLQVDDQLGEVVSSISNLRARIIMESRHLYKRENESIPPWKQCGYRTLGSLSTSGGLTRDDAELALSHDFIQHEKMMAGARTLLALLSQAQDALGRRLEELLLHHMDTVYLMQDTRSGFDAEATASLVTAMNSVDKLQNVFTSLALELYRKQRLVQSLLDAVNDDLLVRDEEDNEIDDGGMNVNPRRVAEKCVRDWPRGSKASHVDVEVLDGLLELGRNGDDRLQEQRYVARP